MMSMNKIEFYIDNLMICNDNHLYKVTIEEVDMEKEEREFLEIYRSLSADSRIKAREIITYLSIGEKNADKRTKKEAENG